VERQQHERLHPHCPQGRQRVRRRDFHHLHPPRV